MSKPGRDGLQEAFRSVWGAEKADSESSSDTSSASRSQSNRQSRRGPVRTATQRTRRGQRRPEAVAKGQIKNTAKSKGRFYWNITGFPFPLGPLLTRRTVRYEVSHKRVHPLSVVGWLEAIERALLRS